MKAVFLDRDGVLNAAIVKNGKPFPPSSINTLEILPGVKEALVRLRKSKYLLIVITNQPDFVRGKISKERVEEINQYILNNLPLDEVLTCFHDDEDHCECRKPKPGAILKVAEKYSLDLKSCYMVGDRWRDISAGFNAGCKTIFIDYGYSEKQPECPDFKVQSLFEASKIILGE